METEEPREDNKDNLPDRPYTNKELRTRLKISERTFRRWMTKLKPEIGERMGHFYTPKQVKLIMDKLSKPLMLIIGVAVRVFGSEIIDKRDK